MCTKSKTENEKMSSENSEESMKMSVEKAKMMADSEDQFDRLFDRFLDHILYVVADFIWQESKRGKLLAHDGTVSFEFRHGFPSAMKVTFESAFYKLSQGKKQLQYDIDAKLIERIKEFVKLVLVLEKVNHNEAMNVVTCMGDYIKRDDKEAMVKMIYQKLLSLS